MAFERWKLIAGFAYFISDKGRVRSPRGRILSTYRGMREYRRCVLRRDGKSFPKNVHTLVADAFLPPKPSPKHTVNHCNGIKSKCEVSNLEWLTKGDNNRHNVQVLGQGRRKLTDAQAAKIKKSRLSGLELAAKFKVTPNIISRIRTGRTYTHV